MASSNSSDIVQYEHKARRSLTRRVVTDTAVTWVNDGGEEGDIQLTVNLRTLATMLGSKALGNKSGIAREAHGAVVAKVLRRRRCA